MDKDEIFSDFEYHESEAQDFGQSHGTQHTHAILAVAAGIKELVEMLRPLVGTITAKPEPLELCSTDPVVSWCLAGDPGSNGFRRCMEPYGHAGDHVHTNRLDNTVVRWSQRHGDVSDRPRGDGSLCMALFPGGHGSDRCVLSRGHDGLHRLVDGRSWDDTPKCGHYGPFIAGEGHARPRCKLSRGHTGRHNDGHGMWGVDAETPRSGSAYQTVDEKRCTALSTLVESQPPMRCIRLFDHSGECRFEGSWAE